MVGELGHGGNVEPAPRPAIARPCYSAPARLAISPPIRPRSVATRTATARLLAPSLRHDVGDVPNGRVLADHQALGDLAVGEPLCHERQHLQLTARKPALARPGPGRRPLPPRAQQSLQPPAPGLGAEISELPERLANKGHRRFASSLRACSDPGCHQARPEAVEPPPVPLALRQCLLDQRSRRRRVPIELDRALGSTGPSGARGAGPVPSRPPRLPGRDRRRPPRRTPCGRPPRPRRHLRMLRARGTRRAAVASAPWRPQGRRPEGVQSRPPPPCSRPRADSRSRGGVRGTRGTPSRHVPARRGR